MMGMTIALCICHTTAPCECSNTHQQSQGDFSKCHFPSPLPKDLGAASDAFLEQLLATCVSRANEIQFKYCAKVCEIKKTLERFAKAEHFHGIIAPFALVSSWLVLKTDTVVIELNSATGIPRCDGKGEEWNGGSNFEGCNRQRSTRIAGEWASLGLGILTRQV